MSLWVGLIVTLGMVFALVPNLEMILLTAFLGGVALGVRRGIIVAVVGEALFSALNPIGSGLGFPILYLLQIMSVGTAGLVGALLRGFLGSDRPALLRTAIMGGAGFLLTLYYDLITAFSFPLSTGMTEGTLWGTLTAGLAFFTMHIVSNTLLFASFGPGLIGLVNRQLEMHGLLEVTRAA